MDVLCSEDVVLWDSVRLPTQKIKNEKCADLNLMNQEYPESIKEQSIHLSRVRDSNYKKADLEQEVKKSIHLTKLK